jgi:tRNA-specific 2-thiouridylase
VTAKKKVIVGLSGGVDSSVAAYLLKQQGYDVTGVTMSLWDGKPGVIPSGKYACYGPEETEEIEETRKLAAILDIPFRVFDCSQRYKSVVLDYFRGEYLSGRTPNPCIKCNQLIKFGMLPELAKMDGLDFDYFATGHYAIVEWDDQLKRYLMKKGTDPRKDQTYFIYRLTQEQLSKVIFPIGNLSKQEVREIAAKIDIPLSVKEESQDFYSGDYKDLLDVKDMTGDIVDRKGNILGRHNGFWNFTIGQRKGLGIAYSEPLYVLSLDTKENKIVVGTREEIISSSFIANDLNWIALESLNDKMEVSVKIRSAQNPTAARIEPFDGDSVKVTFNLPNDSITPGQSAVFYQDDLVIGGGVIERVLQNI